MAPKTKNTKKFVPPWDDIPDSNVFPAMYADLKVVEADSAKTAGDGSLMPTFRLDIIRPKEYKGMPYFLRCKVGNEDDTDAEDPRTWTSPQNIGARNFKQLMKASGVKLAGKSIPEACEEIIGQEVGIKIKYKASGKKGTEYEDVPGNDVGEFYVAGSKEARILEQGDKVSAASIGKPTKKKAAPPPDDDEDEVEEEEDEKPVKKGKARAVEPEDDDEEDDEPAPPKKKAKKPVEEEEEDDEEEDEPPKRAKKKAVEEDDEDDDDDEDEKPRPRGGRR